MQGSIFFFFVGYRLIQNGVASTMEESIHMVYSSPVYAKLECERTKYWRLGVNALYEELIETLR